MTVRISKPIDTQIRYGSTTFWKVSGLPLAYSMRSGGVVRLCRSALRRPWHAVVLGLVLLRIRSEQLWLSQAPTGQALRAYFRRHAYGVFPANRLCRGVILLPETHGAYLRGRGRQALRTNVRRAAALGITCEVSTDRARALDEMFTLDRRRAGGPMPQRFRDAVSRPEVTLLVARDRSGLAVATAGVIIDDSVCLIRVAIATSHEARWALHDYLVRTLIDRGVRYLLADGGGPFGALGEPPRVQHYQHLLGYQLRHLRVAPTRPQRLRRWVESAFVLGAMAAAPFVVPCAAGGMI